MRIERRIQFAGRNIEVAWLLAVGIWLASPARGATLTAINGEVFQGKLALDNGLVMTPEGGSAAKIDFVNVLRARFTDETPASNQIQPGVVLTNGMRLAGPVGSLADAAFKFPARNLTVAAGDIAWIVYQPFAPTLAEKLPAGTGALLPGGDFFEGTIKAADADGAKVMSPIFGPRTFSVKGKEIVALIVRELKPVPAAFEVRTTDGYALTGENIFGDRSSVTLRSAFFGAVKIDVKDLAEIRAGPGRFADLTTLKPPRLTAPAGQPGPPAFSINKALNDQPLTVWGASFSHGFAAGVGVVATWDLPPGFNIFVAQAGLTAGTDPLVQMAFAVYADGRQVFRSPMVGSTDKPPIIRANIAGAKALSLRVEPPAAGAPATGAGIWIEPTLVRR
jgi:NPCBM/NEW2 domain